MLQFDEALLDAYNKLQILFVALEHTVANLDKNGDRFQKDFQASLDYLRNVVCELSTAMGDNNIPLPAQVTREFIPAEFRDLDKTESRMFNFVVLCEYIKRMNYIIKLLEHLKNNQNM